MNFRTSMMMSLMLFVTVLLFSQDMLNAAIAATLQQEIVQSFCYLAGHAVSLLFSCKLLIDIVVKHHNFMMGYILGLYVKMYIVFAILGMIFSDTAMTQEHIINITVIMTLHAVTKI